MWGHKLIYSIDIGPPVSVFARLAKAALFVSPVIIPETGVISALLPPPPPPSMSAFLGRLEAMVDGNVNVSG